VLSEFKAFVLRGNVIDLAVAVVLGVAFGAVITAFVSDIITPILGVIGGKPNFSQLTFTINGSVFYYGSFLNAVIAFLSIAAAIFFFVVKPVNHLKARRAGEDGPPTTRPCPECVSEIPVTATRCAYCTTQVAPAGA
jgi:large conductance mechanosensitive channel